MDKKELYAKIGSKLREARKTKKISCEKVGELLGVSKSTYSYYERGMVRISVDDLITLCNYLNLDFKKLVDDASK